MAKYNGAIGVLLQDETLISATYENMVHNKYVSIQYQRPWKQCMGTAHIIAIFGGSINIMYANQKNYLTNLVSAQL